jgi:hypothetical protein
LFVAGVALGQTPPRTIKTGEIRVVAGDPVPTPAPVKPKTIETGPIRVIAEPPPAKGK